MKLQIKRYQFKPDPALLTIIDKVCSFSQGGVTRDDLIGDKADHFIAAWRAVAMTVLRARGEHIKNIASHFNRHYTNVPKAVARVRLAYADEGKEGETLRAVLLKFGIGKADLEALVKPVGAPTKKKPAQIQEVHQTQEVK